MGLLPSLKTLILLVLIMGTVSSGTLLAASAFAKSRLEPLFVKAEANGVPAREISNVIVNISIIMFSALSILATIAFTVIQTAL